MFVVNTEIKVNWLLPHTTENVDFTDFDVKIVNPNKEVTYINSAVNESDFVKPTHNSTGAVSYTYTPDIEGVWKVILCRGEAPDFDIYYEYFMRVSYPDTHVFQKVFKA